MTNGSFEIISAIKREISEDLLEFFTKIVQGRLLFSGLLLKIKGAVKALTVLYRSEGCTGDSFQFFFVQIYGMGNRID